MASPKQPERITTLPLTDPNNVRETVAQDIIINVIADMMHITYTTTRTKDFDPLTGQSTNERVVTNRIVMPMAAAGAMADCIRQTLTAISTHQATMRPN